MLTVTLVVPNWNGSRLLTKLLTQAKQQTYPIAETVVVDNASTDDSVAVSCELGASVVRLDRNTGFAMAVNEGVRTARSELVAIVNNDVELTPDWLEKLVGGLGSNLFAAGKLLQAGNRQVIDGTFDTVCRGGCAWRCGHGRSDGGLWDEPRSVQIVPMTATLVRRDGYLALGGLDERFESYLEDVDFGLRSASKGYTGAYVPSAVAYHAGSATLGRWHPRTVRQIARNQLLLIAKHYTTLALIRNGWRIAVSQGLWALLALRHGVFLPWLRGKLDGLSTAPAMRGSADPAVAAVTRTSELELLELQKATGFDLYWRIYFMLT